MKPIRITHTNRALIEAALLAANGRAEEHCYTFAHQVERQTQYAEAKLTALNVPKREWAGASFSVTSGAPVSNAYGKKTSTRRATRLTVERRATGWFLTNVECVDIYQKGGAPVRLTLTAPQSRIATLAFQAQFEVRS